MQKMCQSRQFVVTPEEKNIVSKNDKNAKNQQFLTLDRGFCLADITFCRLCFIGVAFEKICCDCITDKQRQSE